MTPAAPVWEVAGRASAHVALRWLEKTEHPVALDVETTDCNPRKQSPVGKARVWSLQLAIRQEGKLRPVFVPVQWVPVFGNWLESNSSKIGSGIYSYDRHALWNSGYELRGVVGCTWQLSKLLNPSEELEDGMGHSLKDWGKRLGYDTTPFSAVVSRPMPGATGAYKRDRVVEDSGCRTVYAAGAEYQNVRWAQSELVSLPEIWELYPQRRGEVIDYACKDALMSWDTYMHLRQKLEEKRVWVTGSQGTATGG